MTTSNGLRGNEGIFVTFKKGTATAVPVGDDLKSFALTTADPDDSDLTFAEAAAGGAEVDSIDLTGIQSTDAASLWRFLWDNPYTPISVVWAPHGNAIASTSQPQFTFTATTRSRPAIGGEARRTKERQSFDTGLDITSPITLVTA